MKNLSRADRRAQVISEALEMVKRAGLDFSILTCASVAERIGTNYRTVQRVIGNREMLAREVARLAKMRGEKAVIKRAQEIGYLP